MQEILPVLLGADMNCYSVARAFHEEYKVKSQVFGRWAMGETKYSRIVRFTAVANFQQDEVMLHTLKEFAKAQPKPAKILLGCTDDYAARLIRYRDVLSSDYIVPYIDIPLMDRLVAKENFYHYCDEYAIAYPATVLLRNKGDVDKLNALPFAYPIIIKPSSSIEYWKNEFSGMKKVYVAQDAQQGSKIVKRIFSSGYTASIIVQDLIPGADDGMRVLTAYSGEDKKVKMMCLGNVLLEEHTPRALGNHAAIVTEYNGPLMEKIKYFLEDIAYTGFSNFDIKYDPRDGQYKVFEINLRQGRSNYYVTGAGLNIAKYLVEDRLLKNSPDDCLFFQGESYWHSIPNEIVWQYTHSAALVEKAQALAAAGRQSTALDYAQDLRLNPLRQLYVKEHYRRYKKKYDTYCIKPER